MILYNILLLVAIYFFIDSIREKMYLFTFAFSWFIMALSYIIYTILF